MSRVLAVLLVLMLLVPAASSQDAPPRLRVPSAEEYLDVVLSFDYGPAEVEKMSKFLLTEIELRYRDELQTLPYTLLRSSFQTLFGASGYYDIFNTPTQDFWEKAMLLAWLHDNHIDLTKHDTLQYDDYDILITPVDFNGDGTPEYIYDVVRSPLDCGPSHCSRKSEVHRYQALLVISQAAPGRHRLIPTPLGWLSVGYHYTAGQSGLLQHIGISDLDNNGLPEWQVAVTHSATSDAAAQLFLLGWHDGRLIDLASPPIYRRVTFDGGPPDISDWSGFALTLRDPDAPLPMTPTLTPPPFATPTAIPHLESYGDFQVYWDFVAGEYEAVVVGVPASAAVAENPRSEWLVPGYYLRALALEGLGRDDEAAAQFAAIAADEAFPDWAALAALHLENP